MKSLNIKKAKSNLLADSKQKLKRQQLLDKKLRKKLKKKAQREHREATRNERLKQTLRNKQSLKPKPEPKKEDDNLDDDDLERKSNSNFTLHIYNCLVFVVQDENGVYTCHVLGCAKLF